MLKCYTIQMIVLSAGPVRVSSGCSTRGNVARLVGNRLLHKARVLNKTSEGPVTFVGRVLLSSTLKCVLVAHLGKPELLLKVSTPSAVDNPFSSLWVRLVSCIRANQASTGQSPTVWLPVQMR
jgi:hypothetical protein